MGKKKTNTTILTEDLFNSNGNTNVSNELLNESHDDTEETKEIEEVNDTIKDNEPNVQNLEIVQDIVIEEESIIEETKEKLEEVINEEKIEENKEDEKKFNNEKHITKTVLKRIGFNDELFYLNDLK